MSVPQGRPSIPIDHIQTCSMSKQQPDDLGMPVPRRIHQSGHPTVVHRIDVCAVLQERSNDGRMAVERCHHERSPPCGERLVGRHPRRQQARDGGEIPPFRALQERIAAAAGESR